MTKNELDNKFVQFTDAIAENIGIPISKRQTVFLLGRCLWVCEFSDYGCIQLNGVTLENLGHDNVEDYASRLVNLHVDANND